eukprot:scpid58856/ scgid19047/ 
MELWSRTNVPSFGSSLRYVFLVLFFCALVGVKSIRLRSVLAAGTGLSPSYEHGGSLVAELCGVRSSQRGSKSNRYAEFQGAVRIEELSGTQQEVISRLTQDSFISATTPYQIRSWNVKDTELLCSSFLFTLVAMITLGSISMQDGKVRGHNVRWTLGVLLLVIVCALCPYRVSGQQSGSGDGGSGSGDNASAVLYSASSELSPSPGVPTIILPPEPFTSSVHAMPSIDISSTSAVVMSTLYASESIIDSGGSGSGDSPINSSPTSVSPLISTQVPASESLFDPSGSGSGNSLNYSVSTSVGAQIPTQMPSSLATQSESSVDSTGQIVSSTRAVGSGRESGGDDGSGDVVATSIHTSASSVLVSQSTSVVVSASSVTPGLGDAFTSVSSMNPTGVLSPSSVVTSTLPSSVPRVSITAVPDESGSGSPGSGDMETTAITVVFSSSATHTDFVPVPTIPLFTSVLSTSGFIPLVETTPFMLSTGLPLLGSSQISTAGSSLTDIPVPTMVEASATVSPTLAQSGPIPSTVTAPSSTVPTSGDGSGSGDVPNSAHVQSSSLADRDDQSATTVVQPSLPVLSTVDGSGDSVVSTSVTPPESTSRDNTALVSASTAIPVPVSPTVEGSGEDSVMMTSLTPVSSPVVTLSPFAATSTASS